MQVEHVLPVKKDIGLCVLDNRLMDLRYILIIKLVPLAIDDVLTICNVVAT